MDSELRVVNGKGEWEGGRVDPTGGRVAGHLENSELGRELR